MIAVRQIERSELRVPALVVDLDLADPARSESDKIFVDNYRSLWCLSRVDEIPINVSFWDVSDDSAISAMELTEQLLRLVAAGPAELARPLPDPAEGSDMTVVICTRDRPQGLRATLSSLRSQTDPDFRVIVVDNGSPAAGTADVTRKLALPGWEYVVEPKPGLSRARNRGLSAVQTRLVGWLDDDEVADRQWVRRIKQGFAHASQPAAVCGVMLPAELNYEAQVRFEQYGGFNKGRGLEPEVLKAGTPSVVSPLYPLPTFGPGGNMAFITEQLRDIGGFDPCLGAGTRTRGCEDMRAFSQVLSSGGAVLHWPCAVTWHTHRRDMEGLQKQFYSYSAGLTAFYASAIRAHPSSFFDILRLVPRAWRDMRGKDGNARTENLPDDFPKELLKVWRRGLIEGAPMYVYETLCKGLDRMKEGQAI